MLKYLPLIVVCIALVPLTIWQWSMMDWVWSSNVPAQQCAYLLQTEIPNEIGDWVGVDQPVDEQVRKTAGADGYISRTYVNQETNERVTVWFIVGHFRNVARHTPNICYRNAGFTQVERANLQPFLVDDLPDSEFRTAKFRGPGPNGQVVHERVFWAWWKPEPLEEGQTADDVLIEWTSPEDPRLKYGFCRALYKLYFTSSTNEEEAPGESVCLDFAQEFLPVVDAELRKSGVVMNNEELPADHEAVFDRMKQANEKGDDEKLPEATEEESSEETTEETTEAA